MLEEFRVQLLGVFIVDTIVGVPFNFSNTQMDVFVVGMGLK